MNGISYFLTWYIPNQEEVTKGIFFSPEPYNWKTYGEMNIAFGRSTRKPSLEKRTRLLEQSHRRVLELIEVLAMMNSLPKVSIKWTGGTSLGSYFVSSTSSHYDWALKKLKAIGRIVGDRWPI